MNRTFIFFAIIGCLMSLSNLDAAKSKANILGYYPSYHAQFGSPKQIPWELYDELTFFVAIPHVTEKWTYPPGLTTAKFNALAPEFVKEAESHNVRPILGVGGFTGSGDFSLMAGNAANRTRYAKFMIARAKEFGFVGIDLDWEYPNSPGIGCNTRNPADTVNFGLFAEEIHKQWPEATLSAAMSITGLIGADGGPATPAETKLLAVHLKYVKMMTYDVFGAWSGPTGPCAPLRATCAPENPLSVETALVAFTKQGFALSQLVIGVTGYARSYELTSPTLVPRKVGTHVSYYYQNHTKITPPGGKTDDKPMTDVCGVKTGWAGIWLVNELIEKGYLSKDQTTGGKGYKRTIDECSGQSFLSNEKYLFSYDDQIALLPRQSMLKNRK